MKTSKTKYMALIAKIHWDSLPPLLQEAHATIMKDTDNGDNWKARETDSELAQLIELVYQKCQELIDNNRTYLTPRDAAMFLLRQAAEENEDIEAYLNEYQLSVDNEDFSAHTEGTKVIVTALYGTDIHEEFEAKPLVPEILSSYVNHKTRKRLAQKRVTYSHMQPEYSILKAILHWDNMLVSKSMVKAFYERLKKYRANGQIGKDSPALEAIQLVEKKIEVVFRSMDQTTTVHLSPDTRKLLRDALKKVTDPQKFARKSKGLDGLTVTSISTPTDTSPVMTSADFANMTFSTIGLKDKWRDFIGDPSPGFTAMVFAMPKMGKSYLCVDFASYLAKNHGKVLYVSKEEYMSPTLALKIKDKNAADPNLDIAGSIPTDLSQYKFVFLDSVTSMKLNPNDLKKLEDRYPEISFIYVFQVTKAGSARGTNEYMHNVDVVIEIPEKGKAIQYGRFNQGGKMDIFPEPPQEALPMAA
jgi:KaiC/GvpD/RAD55 family RecA-like ATPase